MNTKVTSVLKCAAVATAVLFQVAAWAVVVAASLILAIFILFAQPGGLL